METPEITPADAQIWLQSAAPPRLIDVRESDEWEICRIAGAELIPMSQFAALAPKVLTDQLQSLLVYCHHGVRSAHVTQFLLRQGYAQAVNLNGGIDAWSREIDSSVPRY